jgi:hypothetical protein
MKSSKLTALLFLTAFFFEVNVICATSVIVPGITKSNTASLANINSLKASEFVKLSAKDFNRLTGKRLNFFQRISFQIVKLKMKHDLKKNPHLLITDYTKAPSGSDRRFSFLWFILGVAGVISGLMMPVLPLFFVFALAPVAIAYITKQDKVNIKSAWIGFGVGMVLLLILVAIIIATLTTVQY